MALVVISGQPCSGKSSAAICLAESLKDSDSNLTVGIIDETSLHLDRDQTYANMVTNCRRWNEERREEEEPCYKIFDDLVRRFEKPDRINRWDSPLFEIWPSRDGIEKASMAIVDVVSYLTRIVDSKTRDIKVLQPTIAAQSAQFSEANSLYEMDKATQEVTNAIVEAQSLAMGGHVNGLSLGPDLPTISLSRSVGLPELRRLKRTFIKLTGHSSLSGPRPPSYVDSAERMFVDYLNRELGTGL